MSIVWQAPGAEAISEFARQSSGAYLTGTCVETSALMCLIAQQPGARPASDSAIGDTIQQIVNDWRAHNPNIGPSGASSYVDATRWLTGQGCRVDENVMSGGWWGEMVNGLTNERCVYLVGVTNAQGLPGDEAGVHNHGLCAYGIQSDGGIVCGDPDNALAQENMPGDPVGASRVYYQADFERGQISSLTKVYPMSITISDVSSYFHEVDPQHWVSVKGGFPVQLGILAAYQSWPSQGSLAGLTALGLPLAGPVYQDQTKYPGVCLQVFERGALVYDPDRKFDSPPGASGAVYLAHYPAATAPDPAGQAALAEVAAIKKVLGVA